MKNFSLNPDLDRHQNGKADPDRHKNDADPQNLISVADPWHTDLGPRIRASALWVRPLSISLYRQIALVFVCRKLIYGKGYGLRYYLTALRARQLFQRHHVSLEPVEIERGLCGKLEAAVGALPGQRCQAQHRLRKPEVGGRGTRLRNRHLHLRLHTHNCNNDENEGRLCLNR